MSENGRLLFLFCEVGQVVELFGFEISISVDSPEIDKHLKLGLALRFMKNLRMCICGVIIAII